MKIHGAFPKVPRLTSRLNATASVVVRQGLLAFALLAFAGCGGGGGGVGGGAGTPPAVRTNVDLQIDLADVTGAPIAGAVVTLTAGGVEYQTTTNANGVAEFLDLPNGDVSASMSADGFESISWGTRRIGESGLQREYWGVTLNATGAWAIGRAVVLGTRMVELESDGSAMTFSLDVAVIGESSEAIETLTSADFSVQPGACGWYGPRACASDAAGNAPAGNANGDFSPDGGAEFFGLQAPSARHAYIVGVLVARSTQVTDWDGRAAALKSFFTALGGNDTASLASVQTENGSATLTVYGPFTSDGSAYLDAIDQLAEPAGDPPAVLESLNESIRRAAAASSSSIPGTESTVLVLATPLEVMALSEIDQAAALAQQLGVHISAIVWDTWGLPEIAVRTGGFVAEIDDFRQDGMVFGAMNGLLAGTTPFYRMQFRIVAEPGTFVSGGNAKVWLNIQVPTSVPTRGVYTSLDVAIR